MSSLKGVIISGEGRVPPDYVTRSTKGVEFYRPLLCMATSPQERLKKQLENGYMGRVLTFESLEKIRCEVSKFYRKHSQILVTVAVPEQEFFDDVVVITVVESRVGRVNVIGSSWFCEDLYHRYVGLCPGDIIFNRIFEGDVAWINRSPWRKVDAVYKSGKESSTTDIDLYVRDERPINIYFGGDNTGFKVINENRIFTGLGWGNVFGWDHIFAFQFTTAPSTHQFRSYMAHYTAPLPWRHLFILFGGHSQMKVRNPLPPANIQRGKSYQISGRYILPVFPWYRFAMDLKGGWDWKRTNNNLVVGEAVISKRTATVFQLMGAWEGKGNWGFSRLNVETEVFFQPWHFGRSMSLTTYGKLRPGSINTYVYLKGGAHYLWQDPRTMAGFDIKLRGQVTTAPLLPLEMLGLGGAFTVRGYEERAVNVDNGILFNVEGRTPKLPVCSYIQSLEHIDDGLAVLFFVDIGKGYLKNTPPAEPADYLLAGIGPGLRYDIGEWFHARFDLAVPLTKLPSAPLRSFRIHFGLAATY